MKNPTLRIKMLDGFNEGWIEFESAEAGSRKGKVPLGTVLQALIERELVEQCVAGNDRPVMKIPKSCRWNGEHKAGPVTMIS
jgi:hypothetical protein